MDLDCREQKQIPPAQAAQERTLSVGMTVLLLLVKACIRIAFSCVLFFQRVALSAEPEARMEMVLRQAAQGDQQAFAEIVREHQGMVFSICWHFLGDRALAEDLAQEVFLQLYRGLPAIQSPSHLTHWLRRTAVHRCIDHTRRKYFRSDSPLEKMPEIATGTAPADLFLHERLRQTVAQLGEKQRMAVLLRYQEELGLDEIAELLKMPVNTVKSTLHRALEELRGKLTRKLKEARYAIF